MKINKVLIRLCFFIMSVFLICFSGINAQIDWVTDPDYPVINQYDEWDSVTIIPYYFLPCDSGYHLWFGGSNDSLTCGAVTRYKVGYAFSHDGENWTVNPEPVLQVGTPFEYATIQSVSVVQEGGIFKMWYTYDDGTTSGDAVGYATSPDGVTWTEYAWNPVMQSGFDPGDWDYNEIYNLRVIYEDTVYKMWYTAYDSSSAGMIGVAKSYDGIIWEKHGNNPFIHETTFPEFELADVMSPNVIKDGLNNYKALFFGVTSDGGFGNIFACSYDGLEWRLVDDADLYANEGWWMASNVVREDTAYLTYGGFIPAYNCDSLEVGPIYRRYINFDTSEHYFLMHTGDRYYYSYYDSMYYFFEIGNALDVYETLESAYFPGFEVTIYVGNKGETPSAIYNIYFYNNNGIWVWYDPSGMAQTPSYLRFKDQLLTGDTWLDVGNVFGGPDDTTYYWCLSDSVIETPLGEFDVMCVIDENPPDHCERIWFTEGGGIVKVETCNGYTTLEIDSAYIDGEWFYPVCCTGKAGNIDCSASEDPDISDITRLIDYLYLSQKPLCCPEEADCNGSGGYPVSDPDISDITLLIDHLYLSHMPLADCQ
ncbi:MAG: hypothetical protein ACOYVF_05890 [Candidatus Zixiibacteriota bacterium]